MRFRAEDALLAAGAFLRPLAAMLARAAFFLAGFFLAAFLRGYFFFAAGFIFSGICSTQRPSW